MAVAAENKKKTLFEVIKELGGISNIWQKVLEMVKEFQADADEDAMNLLCIYFALLDDGNICIALDEKKLFEKWDAKWKGLIIEHKENIEINFKSIIKNGIDDILSGKLSDIVERLEDNKEYSLEEADRIEKLFVVKEYDGVNWLYAAKYFAAKICIEERVKVLFPSVAEPADLESQQKNVIQYFEDNTWNKKRNCPIALNSEQSKAVVLGKDKNLIVTGGPGTGKTTAVCFLLWQLLKEEDAAGRSYSDYKLYLAAPSGKAAERMKESISGSLSDFKDEMKNESPEIYSKLIETDSSTIHRLLSLNPSNGVGSRQHKQFDEESIFVIDEASMIDILLFRTLLEAIPDKARLFILGDKDQLPSVQAGAVLGELLSKKTDSKIELVISNRFNDNSQVGRLKKLLLDSEELTVQEKILGNADKKSNTFIDAGTVLDESKEFKFERKAPGERTSDYPVFLYSLKTPDKKAGIPSRSLQIKSIAEKWSKAFCTDLRTEAKLGEKSEVTNAQLKNLWRLVNEAKILCAGRQGILGVAGFNEVISKTVLNGKNADNDGYFVGQPLIITQNQQLFRLYNGDTGVVVSFNNDKLKYMMVEKKASSDETDTQVNDEDIAIFRRGDFMFYPLYLLPSDSLETAYAITIHKSQGSGYANIMVILPEENGHPLLNRQIVYTAVTRTEGNTYLIAQISALNYAKAHPIERDTNICLN